MWYSEYSLQQKLVDEVRKMPEGCQVSVIALCTEAFGKKMLDDIAWIEMIKLADDFPHLMERHGIEAKLIEAQKRSLMSPYHLYQIDGSMVQYLK